MCSGLRSYALLRTTVTWKTSTDSRGAHNTSLALFPARHTDESSCESSPAVATTDKTRTVVVPARCEGAAGCKDRVSKSDCVDAAGCAWSPEMIACTLPDRGA